MPGRFPLLLVLLAVFLTGCATVSEERFSMLESAVMDLQANDIRLASLEETVAGLVARQGPPESRHDAGRSRGPASGPANAPAPRTGSPAPPPAPQTAVSPSPSPAPARMAEQPPVPVKPVPAKIHAAQAAGDYQAALVVLESGRPQAALPHFQDFLRKYPGHALAPNAGYWLGECHYSLRQYDAAIVAFKDVVAQFPAHDKAAAAMLKAGYSYEQLGDPVNARFYLEALLKDYPSSQPASLARTRLASL